MHTKYFSYIRKFKHKMLGGYAYLICFLSFHLNS